MHRQTVLARGKPLYITPIYRWCIYKQAQKKRAVFYTQPAFLITQ